VEDASVEAHTDPTRRGRSVIAWTIAGLSVAVMATSPAIKIVSGTLFGADDTAIILPGLLGGLAFAVVGALIAARTGNAVGWVFLGIAASFAISIPAQNWVDVAIEDGRPVAFLGVANWLSQWPFFVCLGLLPAVFFLFPTGRLPSRRWKIPWRVYLAALVVTVVGFALLPYRWDGVEGVIVTNPVGIPSAAEPVVGGLLAVAGLLLVASAFVALASLIVRARGADPETRQQIRWLGAVGRVGGVLFALTLAAGIASGNRETGFAAAAADVLMVLLVVTIVVGIPAATAVAIFRFRLFDLDLVVKKTVQYGVLVALFVAVGLLVVVAIPTAIVEVGGTSEALPVLVLAAVLAGAFLWLRPRAARLADRIVFGGRATPYEVLTEFSDRVGETYAADDVLPRMASVLGEGTGAATATVWLQLGGRLRPDATWPPAAEAPVSPPPGSVDVTHRGERLGALSVTMPPDDPMDPSKERLLRDLAAQAGLVLRNVRLIEELRASRQRLVAAQDDERRKLERDIHDGVQQQLVALNVQLGLLATIAARDPERAVTIATDLQATATATLEDLRDLARGIYPPLLADQGLEAAIGAQARKAIVPTAVEASGVGRYGQEVEAAVYFSVLEAMNNVAKYAHARAVMISLAQRNGSLEFRVEDDGQGFDPATTERGTGLQGISDRVDAIGGEVRVESAPGAGTRVTGSVPVDGA
jgi:signal transduction histidine kinase